MDLNNISFFLISGYLFPSIEPAASRVILVIMCVGLVGLLAMFSNIFGWDNMPIIGEMSTLVGTLGGSGIWYYLIGIMIGVGAIIANLVGGVLAD